MKWLDNEVKACLVRVEKPAGATQTLKESFQGSLHTQVHPEGFHLKSLDMEKMNFVFGP